MGRVQLRKIQQIKKARTDNFNYLYSHLEEIHYNDQDWEYVHAFTMPKAVKNADVCWFAFPLTYHGNRGELLRHLEKNCIETRPLFSGNISKHPAYAKSKFKIN